MAAYPNPHDRNILIASSNVDRPVWQPIANDLTKQGFGVWPVLSDRIASGSIPFDLIVDEKAGLTVYYDGYAFNMAGMNAAYWYRPHSFIPDEHATWEDQMRVNAERRAALDTMWNLVPERAWLNSPHRMRLAVDKLGQLGVAASLGLRVPRALVTNSWSTVLDNLPRDVIFKAPSDILQGDGTFVLHAMRVMNTEDQALLERNPFPGIWEENVQGNAEIRVTIVGDDVFVATIRTVKKEKNGWKWSHSAVSRVVIEEGTIPDDIRAKCQQFLAHYGLRFGSFKFVEKDDGLTAIDFNAHASWGWQEEALHQPITRAIASQLAKIALS